MVSARKRWGTAGVALLLVGAGALLWYRSAAPRKSLETPEQQDARRWRGFAAAEAGFGSGSTPFQATGAGQAVAKPQLDATMDAWRNGILNKDVEVVGQLDQAFVDRPGLYGPELLKMAEKEPNERVRAFCTRVLGKLKNAELADVFQRLLADPSPFVRQNAAWALGELAAHPAGRQAALGSLAELRHAEQEDPAPDVRLAAGKALRKLQ